jgi:hypothetical protein
MTEWLLDTNLLVDWCLWTLADDHRDRARAERAQNQLSILRTAPARDTFARWLRLGKVVVATSTIAETAHRLGRLLAHRNAGDADRLNEPVIRSLVRFEDAFRPVFVRVEEERANREHHRPGFGCDFGDACLISILDQNRTLMTSDRPLWEACISQRRQNVLRFVQAGFVDVRGNPVKERDWTQR